MSDEHADDALRRQLRFSLFLQSFAALMLTVALVVRLTAFGFDLVVLVLAVAVVLVLAAGVYTFTRMRRL